MSKLYESKASSINFGRDKNYIKVHDEVNHISSKRFKKNDLRMPNLSNPNILKTFNSNTKSTNSFNLNNNYRKKIQLKNQCILLIIKFQYCEKVKKLSIQSILLIHYHHLI